MAGSAYKIIARGEVAIKVWLNLCITHQDPRPGTAERVSSYGLLIQSPLIVPQEYGVACRLGRRSQGARENQVWVRD